MLIFNIEQGTARSTCARTGLFCLVDRPLRRAMLNPSASLDILNIEQAAFAMLRRAKGTARSTRARQCFAL